LILKGIGSPDVLNEYSKQVADALIQQFPEFARLLHEEESGGLLIEVPTCHADCTLWISTNNDEITVGFAQWHQHFGDFGSSGSAVQNASRFIRDFIQDRLLIGIYFRDGEWAGSTSFSLVEEATAIESMRSMFADRAEQGQCKEKRFVVYGWSSMKSFVESE
jgi:hypothetical protein